MFDFFSLKDTYDDRVSGYLMIISLCKWAGIFFIIIGLFLAFYFSNSWFAIIGGTFITLIGFFAAIISHYLRKKLEVLADKAGVVVSHIETKAKNTAKTHLNKIIKQDDHSR